MIIFQLFAVVFVGTVYTSSSVSAGDQNEVNQAFKQMSKYCFEEIDCQKCADSFHESATNIQATVFDKLTSSDGLTKMVEDTISSASSSFRDKLLAGCQALLKAKAKSQSSDAHLLFTNYSGTASSQGVFLTTLYSLIPQISELNDSAPKPQFLATLGESSISTNATADSSDSKWQQYIPKAYRKYYSMGQGVENQQNSSAEVSNNTSTPKAVFLVSVEGEGTPFGQYIRAIPIIGQFNASQYGVPDVTSFNMSQVVSTVPFQGFGGYNIPGINSYPGMDPTDIEKYSEANKMYMPNASNYNSFKMPEFPFQMPNASDYQFKMPELPFQMPNASNYISFKMPEFPFQMPNASDYQFKMPEMPFHMPNGSTPPTDIPFVGAYDIGKLNNLPGVESLNLTDMAYSAVLFIDTDGNTNLVIQPYEKIFNYKEVSEVEDPMYSKDVLGKVKEIIPSGIDQLKESISKAGESIGQRLKDAANGSVEDLQTSGREMLQTVTSSYGISNTDGLSSNQIVPLSNNQFAMAQPISFYVETKDGKIVHLEQIPIVSKMQQGMEGARQRVETAMESIKNVIEGYWNKFVSGSCTDASAFISNEFEGLVDALDFSKFLQPAEQFASDSLKSLQQSYGVDKYSQSTENFMGSQRLNVQLRSDLSKPKSILSKVVSERQQIQKTDLGKGQMEGKSNTIVLVDQSPIVVQSCELAKQNNVFDNVNSPLVVNDMFFNRVSQHGVAMIDFPTSVELDGGEKFNFDDLYQNLTQVVQETVEEKMDQAQMSYNQLRIAAQEKLGQLKENVTSAMGEALSKKEKLMQDFSTLASKKLNEVKLEMDKAADKLHKQLTDRLEKVKKCKAGDEDCVISAISLYEVPPQKQIVTFFKSTPDGKKIVKMINFEAIKHNPEGLLPHLETALVPEASVAFSAAALGIYASLGVGIFLVWVWASLKPRTTTGCIDDEDGLLASTPVITEDVPNASYYRMQDI